MIFATRTTNPTPLTPSSSKEKGKEKEKSLKTPVCYAKMFKMPRGRPNLTLRGMPDSFDASPTSDLSATPSNGPTLGIVRLPKISRHLRVGLGDPLESITNNPDEDMPTGRAGEAGLTWIDIKNPSATSHALYTFTYQPIGAPGVREYAWRRTKDASHGIEGGAVARAFTLYSYILVEVASGEEIAVLLETAWRSVRKVSKLRLFRALDDELWLVVVLTCSAILEKQRRRGGG